MSKGCVQSKVVAICAKPRDLADTHGAEVAHRAKRLARVDVRHVNLDRGHLHGLDRIAQPDRRVRQATRVDHDRIGPRARELDECDQLALEVRLRAAQLRTASFGAS